MERPVDNDFVQRWQLACESDIAHVVVMPNITKEKIELFVTEFEQQRNACGMFELDTGAVSQKNKLTSW